MGKGIHDGQRDDSGSTQCHFVDKLSPEQETQFEQFVHGSQYTSYMQWPMWARVVARSKLHQYSYVWCETGGEWSLAGLVRVTKILPGYRLAVFQRGPVFRDAAAFKDAMPVVLEQLKRQGVSTVIMNPPWEGSGVKQVNAALVDLGFKALPRSATTLHANTAVVDLRPAVDEIFAGFRGRCRRNVRSGSKKGLIIRQAESEADAVDFQEVHDIMWRAQGMDTSGQPDTVEAWKYLANSKDHVFLLAEIESRVVGGIIAVREGRKAMTFAIASSPDYPKIPRTSGLYWEIMQRMKETGCEEFDMAGFPPGGIENSKDAQERNRSHFKLGFNPTLVPLVASHVIALRPVSHALFFTLRQWYRRSPLLRIIGPWLKQKKGR